MSDAHPFTPIDLQDLLDGQLPEPRRSVLAAHAADCSICRRELATLQLARGSVGASPARTAPPELRVRVVAGLDVIDRERLLARKAWPTGRRFRFLAGAGILAAAAVAFLLLSRDATLLRPFEIAADYTAVVAGDLVLEVRGDQPAVEEFFRWKGFTFPARVADMGMMGMHVVGGAVRAGTTNPRTLVVYRSAAGRTLICEMYVARTADLPAPDDVRENNGIRFFVHREGDVTLVFWQDGDMICVLASDAPPEEVIALAMSKAAKA